MSGKVTIIGPKKLPCPGRHTLIGYELPGGAVIILVLLSEQFGIYICTLTVIINDEPAVHISLNRDPLIGVERSDDRVRISAGFAVDVRDFKGDRRVAFGALVSVLVIFDDADFIVFCVVCLIFLFFFRRVSVVLYPVVGFIFAILVGLPA